jgi:hypothetical protein
MPCSNCGFKEEWERRRDEQQEVRERHAQECTVPVAADLDNDVVSRTIRSLTGVSHENAVKQLYGVHGELHFLQQHPGWEYTTTECGRKQFDPEYNWPAGDGWVSNLFAEHDAMIREDYSETHYWMRPAVEETE